MTGLGQVLAEAQTLGFLGPGPVERHIEHAVSMLACVPAGHLRLVDLGAGGGVPGLVLACRREDIALTLLDSQQRRCAFLREAVVSLGLADRAEVVEGRAEAAARGQALRESADVVVARSFGPPAVTAECAVGFLRVGGHLVVSEPPGGDAMDRRWPAEGLETLGFSPVVPCGRQTDVDGEGTFVRLVKTRSDDRWPRRVGIPTKRPWWAV